MKGVTRVFITGLLLALSLVILMFIAKKQDVSISNVQLSVNSQPFVAKNLPLKENIIGTYDVKMELKLSSWGSKELQIIPDDELLAIKVNGQDISLAGYSKKQLRDYGRGITIKIDELNADGPNLLEFSLKNESNPAGFNVKQAHSTTPLGLTCIFIALLIGVYAVSRHISLTKTQYALLTIGLIASLAYLSKTSSYTRTFDVYEGGGHRDYIEYLITHLETPPPGEGWEYHQPPLYYVIAALTKTQLSPGQLYSDFWGQLLALWFWSIFLIASLGALKKSLGKKACALFVASAAVCLWPAGIIHSIRIGNDIPLYAFYALSFYYCLGWWHKRTTHNLLYASIWASMALLTKSNALAVWGVLGVIVLIHCYRLWCRRHKRAHQMTQIYKTCLIVASCFVVTMVLNFGDNVWHYVQGTSSDWLLSNVSESINPGLKVGNALENYVIFDMATFLQNPYISTWDDRYGRQYFWNFVWRSALTAEFFFEGKALFNWGIANGIFLLMMLAGIATYAIQQHAATPTRVWRLSIYKHLPWLLALAMPFILLLAYRIKVPLSCNTDFRYIYPVLLPMLFFSSRVWNYFPRFTLSWLLALGAPLISLSTLVWLVVLLGQ
jgi:hypothetical protein